MLKPDLTCPEGHPITKEWLASMWGKWMQWRSYVKLGKKEFVRIKSQNAKKKEKKELK